MKLPWLMVLLVVALLTPAQAEVVNKIAAVVNDEIITTHQLDLKLADFLASQAQGSVVPPEQMANLRQEFLDRLIEEQLVQQKIRELKLSASDAEIEAAIEDILRQNQITREQLAVALQGQGLSFEAYREKMREQILRFKLIGREVQSKVDVTDQDVRAYFRDHIDDYREPPTVTLDHLQIPLPQSADSQSVALARKTAEQALARLRSGESLGEVLASYDGATGGPMGSFKKAELSPLIRQTLTDMRVGDYSEVVAAPAGMMIFHLVAETPGSIRQFDEAKIEIRQMLTEKSREERFKTWSRELRKAAYIDIRI